MHGGLDLAFEARLAALPVISGGRAVAPARSVGIQHESSTVKIKGPGPEEPDPILTWTLTRSGKWCYVTG